MNIGTWFTNFLVGNILNFLWVTLSAGFVSLLTIIGVFFYKRQNFWETLENEWKTAIIGGIFAVLLAGVGLGLILPPTVIGYSLSTSQGISVPIVRATQGSRISMLPTITPTPTLTPTDTPTPTPTSTPTDTPTPTPTPTPPPPPPPPPPPIPPCFGEGEGPFYFELPAHNSVFSFKESEDISIRIRLKGKLDGYTHYEIRYVTGEPTTKNPLSWICLGERKAIKEKLIEETWDNPPSGEYWLLPIFFTASKDGNSMTDVKCAVKVIIK